MAASPAAALGAALKGLKGRTAPPLAAPGPPRRPPGRGVRAAPAPVLEPRPRLQLPSPRGNVTGETWAVPQVQGTWAPGAMTRTPLTLRSRGQLSFLRWECGRASPAAPPVHIARGCHRARGWKKPSSTASVDYVTLGKLLQLPQCGTPSPATVSTGMRQVGEKPSTKHGLGLGNPKQAGFCPPNPVPSGPPLLANSGKGLL